MISFERKPRLFGVVAEFGPTFGFITGQDGARHFCHFRDLPLEWRPDRFRDQLVGRSVTFEVGERDGRRKAIRVFVIDEADEDLVGAVIDVADVR